MAILEGSVVFIDDEFSKSDTDANAFYLELQREGRPVASYSDVPPHSHLEHWDGLALAVVDWNLTQPEARVEGVALPQMASDFRRSELIEFLRRLLDRYFCPIFIVSADLPEDIHEALKKSPGFPSDAIGRRIHILRKANGALLPRLDELVRRNAVLSTLRTWEQQYQAAKNRMFIDLDEFGEDWLIFIRDAAAIDKIDAGYELVNALYGNLQHRVNPVAFNFDLISGKSLPDGSAAQRAVVHGRSVLAGGRLYKETIMPGDFFATWRKSDPAGALWMNLTPACYTVRGRKGADVRLHLIRGIPVKVEAKEPEGLRRLRNKETRSVYIDVLHEGKAYKFEFSTLETLSWATIAKSRIGRLLPPYITAVQQRYATYITSEGLPVVMPGMYREAIV